MSHDHSNSHNHGNGHGHNHQHHASGNIKVAFFLNLGFTIFEIIGGILTNSMAILSDALHDLGDSISLGIAWYFERYSRKAPDQKFTFGYSRFSLVGAIVNSIVLVVGSVLILVKAVPRVLAPESVQPQGMIILAIVGIVINGLAVLRLRTGSSLNEKVVSWHLLEDVLGWVVVLIAGIVLLFVNIPVIDPLLSIAITLYVLFNVLKRLKEIFHVLLQGVPDGIDIAHIEEEILEIQGIASVHHTHVWSLEGEKHMMSTHVVFSNEVEKEKIAVIKDEVKHVLEHLGIEHVTLETEFENENCESIHCDTTK
jgi:cobalt-zinc-cadmium efflux system protein